MRTTSSFEIFPNEASERELARARWLRREGRIAEAESAYRSVMRRQPTLRSSWMECFELLRSGGRLDEALEVAGDAARVFRDEAFPMTLKGAALIEGERYQEAIRCLELSVDRDPDLALTWHELGYAAFKLGDGNRALLALDRAFALEPHTETLILRGRILRDAGELYAAEVAFEAARHSASHEDQQREVRLEILRTRRLGAFPPKWIRPLNTAEQWFADHGIVVIASEPTDVVPGRDALVDALAELVTDRGWEIGQVVTPDPLDSWQDLATRLGVKTVAPDALEPARHPLLVADRVPGSREVWDSTVDAISAARTGVVAVLHHDVDVSPPTVDIVGALDQDGRPLLLAPDSPTALLMAQHPAARLAERPTSTTHPATS